MSPVRLTHLHAKRRDDAHPVAWRGDGLINWRTYHNQVLGLVDVLAARNERRWLLACEDPLDFAVGLFALWHTGKEVVIPPSFRPGTLDSLGQVTDARLDAGQFACKAAEDPAGEALLPPLDPARTRLELFTSGSTGEPKGVMKTLAQLDNEVMVLEQVWGRRAATTLATVPHQHIYGLLFRILWPLAGGRPFDTLTCSTPEQLLQRLDEIGPGIVISSPSQLARMPELVDLGLLRGKAIVLFSSGGPLAAAAAARFQDALGEAPLEIYGSTETGGIAWRRQHDGDDAWTLQPGVSLHLAENGTLTLTSPFLPDETPVQTGDAAQWTDDGRFRLLGRIDRIVKVEEKRLALPELEARLCLHPWVEAAAALVLEGRRQSIGAVLVLNRQGLAALAREGRAGISRQLRQHLAYWYDAVLLPRYWRYPPALPYDERGKLVQADLRNLFNVSSDA